MNNGNILIDAFLSAFAKTFADNWTMWLLLAAMYVTVLALKSATKPRKRSRGRRRRTSIGSYRSGSTDPAPGVRLAVGLVFLTLTAVALVPSARLAVLHLLGWIGIFALGMVAVSMAVYALWPTGRIAQPSVKPQLVVAPAAKPGNNYRAAKRIGDAGEKSVANILKAYGMPTISDLVLPVGGGFTQIDHVVLAGRTLVCLETKTWSGLVLGEPADPSWTVVDAAGRKHRHQNPLSQNRRHVTALRRRFPDADVRSFVVMAGKTRFRQQPAQVVMLHELEDRLAGIVSPVWANEALLEGWRALERHRASAAHRRDATAHDAFMRSRDEAASVSS